MEVFLAIVAGAAVAVAGFALGRRDPWARIPEPPSDEETRALSGAVVQLCDLCEKTQNAALNIAHEMARMRFYGDRPERAAGYDATRAPLAATPGANGRVAPVYEGPTAEPAPPDEEDGGGEPGEYPYSS